MASNDVDPMNQIVDEPDSKTSMLRAEKSEETDSVRSQPDANLNVTRALSGSRNGEFRLE